MSLEKFIKYINENIELNENEKEYSFLQKAIESFKNKLVELTSIKDLTVNVVKGRGAALAAAARLVSPSNGLALDVAIFTNKLLEGFPLLQLSASLFDLRYINKGGAKPGQFASPEAFFSITALYNSKTSSLVEFSFTKGDANSFNKAFGYLKNKENSKSFKSFSINLNYYKETDNYNLSLLDNRSSAKTDLAGITQELRLLGVSRIENILELAKSRGAVKLVVSPSELKKSSIGFK